MTNSQGNPKTTFRIGVSLVALAVLLAGCSAPIAKGSQDIPRPEPVVEEVPEVEPELEEEEPEEPQQFWPLTGVGISPEESGDGAEVEFGPVLSVKVENSRAARPQGGLENADLVWEELVEGGMTRFIAMFHSDVPDAVGPIRSVRGMDAAVVGQVGGVLAFSGGLSEYQSRISRTGVKLAADDRGSRGFYRDSARRGEHSLFGRTADLLAHGEGKDGPSALFAFAGGEEEPSAAAGKEAARVDLRFPASRPSWTWDGKAWLRSESGEPALSAAGVRLDAANVVVLRVGLRDTGKRDGAGSRVLETILTGEGSASVFSAGRVVEGTWRKGRDTDLLTLTDSAGEQIRLAPGRTWIELLPTSSSMSVG